MCIRVDLPEPDGPMIATNSPASIVSDDVAQRFDRERAGLVGLADAFEADDRLSGRDRRRHWAPRDRWCSLPARALESLLQAAGAGEAKDDLLACRAARS